MLDKFIDCYCNQNYLVLIKSGNPPQEALIEAWTQLQERYAEIVGGDDYQAKIGIVTTINDLTFKVHRIEALLEVMFVAPTEGLYMQLYEFGYMLPQLAYSEENIERLCKLVTAGMKRDIAEIQLLVQRMKDEEVKSDSKVTEETFYNILIEIADAFKVVLNEKETNVMAFAMYVRKYKEKAEHIQKQNLKYG